MNDHHRIPGQYGQQEIAENKLLAWPNQHQHRDTEVRLILPEYTCLCPQSGFPDFAMLFITYVPDKWMVELKSLKLFINSFRNMPVGHEATPNIILEHLVTLLSPRWMQVVADFQTRGNIKMIASVEYAQPDYQGPRPTHTYQTEEKQ
jgi:7-cyano-7-deazaguanine reductase